MTMIPGNMRRALVRVTPVSGERVIEAVSAGAQARKSKRLLIYLHIPFCSSKCHFCDWVIGYEIKNLTNTGELRQQYVDAMVNQIRWYGPRLMSLGYEPTNVYWGGGTPTRITPAQLVEIWQALEESFDLRGMTEHTVECSPETVTVPHIEALQAGRLNRISIGVQSFDDNILRLMGRAHNAHHARESILMVQGAGLKNLNIDLIIGFPDQNDDSVRMTVASAIALEIPHISLYMFREFASSLISVQQVQRGSRQQTERSHRQAIYFEIKELLERAGYEEYIVGYFSRSESYRFGGEAFYFGLSGDYVGFGSGAYSLLGHHMIKNSDEMQRYGTVDINKYITDPCSMDMMLAAKKLPLSSWGDSGLLDKPLATKEGINFEKWKDQYGFDFQEIRRHPEIARWFEEKRRLGALFIEGTNGISLTPETWASTGIWRR